MSGRSKLLALSAAFIGASLPAVADTDVLPGEIDIIAEVKQDNLPSCSGPVPTWNDCSGASTMAAGAVRFTGEFKNGWLSKGVIVDNNVNQVMKGNFDSHVHLTGIGEVDYPKSLLRFVGHFVGGRENGKGLMYAFNGEIAEGNYVDGHREGQFTTRDAKGVPFLSMTYLHGEMVSSKNIAQPGAVAFDQVSPEPNRQKLEAACRAYVTAKYTQSTSDVYGHQLRQDVPPRLFVTYGAVRRQSFNNHWFVVFSATIDRYVDGRSTDRKSLPYTYCVFGDGYEVIALDTEERS